MSCPPARARRDERWLLPRWVGPLWPALGGLALGALHVSCATARFDTTGQSQVPRTLRDETQQGNVPSAPGQHPGVAASHGLAEGDTGKPDLDTARKEDAERERAAAEKAAKPPSFLPDPEPTAFREQWLYTFRYRGGVITVEAVESRVLPKPRAADRRIGRFALELWIGKELLERVRFDFPLLGAPLPDAKPGVELEPGLDVTRQVWLPDVPRATLAQLVDRATGRVIELPWPPTAPGDGVVPSKTAD